MIADFMFSLSLVDRFSLLNFKVLYKLFLFYLAPFLRLLSCAFYLAPFLRLLKQNTREQVPGVERRKMPGNPGPGIFYKDGRASTVVDLLTGTVHSTTVSLKRHAFAPYNPYSHL